MVLFNIMKDFRMFEVEYLVSCDSFVVEIRIVKEENLKL